MCPKRASVTADQTTVPVDRAVDAYFSSRLTHDPKRDVLWRTLCEDVFQHYAGDEAVVMELGAGWGDFINNIAAKRRIAVDIWPGTRDNVEPSVEVHIGPATDLSFCADGTVDLVFASNLIEHLALPDVRRLVAEAKRVLALGGRLVLVQPNFRLCANRYFDDYTHVSVWSDIGLCDFLRSEGLEIEVSKPRFMPLSVKSRLPVWSSLVRAYLRSPVKPRAGQMLVVARMART